MPTSSPPDLPGYDFLRELGHGGFADVHLYRQHLPSREVAVKVLREATRSDADREQFENETNRMAMLSSHPGIVTIYEVGVAPDGRPYLTMEFCPNDHFGNIARARPLTVARALEVGIKVASAVETAHQAAILHRDIKPANVLLTAYKEPALTDFGIAGGSDVAEDAVAQGVSIPFAAPEVVNGSTSGDEKSDVYSLGATVYALLAGRSPFSTGTPLDHAQHIHRILHVPLPPTGRTDVPPSLERVLAIALTREPAHRYDSAAAFGRALQAVEAELGLAQTPLRIADTSALPAPPEASADDDTTVFRTPQRVDPDGPAAARPGPPAPGPALPPEPPREGTDPAWTGQPLPLPVDSGLGDRTVSRRRYPATASSTGAAESEATTAAAGRPDRRIVASIAGALVLVAVIALVLSQVGGRAGNDTPSTTTPDTSPLVLTGAPGRPERVRVEPAAAGGQDITWSAPAREDGDSYQVTFTEGPAELSDESSIVEETELHVDTDRRVCVVVEAIRDGRVSDPSTEVCTR